MIVTAQISFDVVAGTTAEQIIADPMKFFGSNANITINMIDFDDDDVPGTPEDEDEDEDAPGDPEEE